jgi:hypothetical protein
VGRVTGADVSAGTIEVSWVVGIVTGADVSVVITDEGRVTGADVSATI